MEREEWGVGRGETESLCVAWLSDRGQCRAMNQDACHTGFAPRAKVATHGELFLVADGMGGHEGGDVASGLACDTVVTGYYEASLSDADDPAPALQAAFRAANERILAESRRDPRLREMGTTCTAALVRGDRLWVAHVGDSRAYLLRRGALRLLTHDHTVAAALLANGRISARDADDHYGRHILTRTLGVGDDSHVDLQPPTALESGDRILLCSDGLYGVLRDEEIAARLGQRSLEEAVAQLIAEANARGGPDNITAVVIEKRAAPRAPST